MNTVRAYVALGANIGAPVQHLRAAVVDGDVEQLAGAAHDGEEVLAAVEIEAGVECETAAQRRGEQAGAHPMAHHVADEHHALRVRKLDHLEEVAPETGRRQVAMGEAQGARLRRHPPREHRVGLGEEHVLDLAGHPQIRLHLDRAIAQLLLHPFAFGDVMKGDHRAHHALLAQ